MFADFFIEGMKVYGHKDCFTSKGGKGVALSRLGTMIDGHFRNGLRNGYCEEIYDDGDDQGSEIKGEFKDGKQ